MVSLKRIFIYLWVLPTTAMGLPLLLAALLGGGRLRWVDGVGEASGGLARFMLRYLIPLRGGASAITFGHLVIACDQECLDWTRSHERVHVRQCERWGPLFIPAYLVAGLVTWMQGKRTYLDNPFEREAEMDAVDSASIQSGPRPRSF